MTLAWEDANAHTICLATGSQIFTNHRDANAAARHQQTRNRHTRRLNVYPCHGHYHVGTERRHRRLRRAA